MKRVLGGPRAAASVLSAALVAGAVFGCKQTLLITEMAAGDQTGGQAGLDAGGGGGHPDAHGGPDGSGGAGGGDKSGDGSVDAAAPRSCEGGSHISFTQHVSDVIVAVDRSMSMLTPTFGGMTSFDAAVQQAVAVANKYRDVVHFSGLPFPSGPSSNCHTDASCCAASVPAPTKSVGGFSDQLMCSVPLSCPDSTNERATTAALNAASAYFGRPDYPNGRYVVVVTNGPPGACGSSMDCPPEAFNAVTGLANAGIPVYFVSLADPSRPDNCLPGLARLNPDQKRSFLLPASSPGDLFTALDSIVNMAANSSCTLELLNGPYNPGQLLVFSGSNQIPPVNQSSMDGWQWFGGPSSSIITLRGKWCDAIKSGSRDVLTVCTSDHGP